MSEYGLDSDFRNLPGKPLMKVHSVGCNRVGDNRHCWRDNFLFSVDTAHHTAETLRYVDPIVKGPPDLLTGP